MNKIQVIAIVIKKFISTKEHKINKVN